MNKLLLGIAASAALFAAGAANATSVSLWTDQVAAASDATLDNVSVAALGAPSATLTVGSINFRTDNSDGTTIDQWLGSSIGGAVGGHTLDNTVFLFTGSTFLAAGDNSFVVPHDDGLQLNIDGIGLVVDAPGPTGEVDTPFNVDAPTAGFYNFELSYGECCGGPAVIEFDVNGAPAGVPEPATWAMMLAGFGGLGAAMRARRRSAAATA